jgi:hypothetical protein
MNACTGCVGAFIAGARAMRLALSLRVPRAVDDGAILVQIRFELPACAALNGATHSRHPEALPEHDSATATSNGMAPAQIEHMVLHRISYYARELKSALPSSAFAPARSRLAGLPVTNHSLSPLTQVNDPLVNSLTVTAPRWIEWLTLRFGYHVEHHLFPAMSSRHSPLVRAFVRERWPERYQSMSLTRALLTLHRTARVYENDTTLLAPRTGRTCPTLLPRDGASTDSTPIPLAMADLRPASSDVE